MLRRLILASVLVWTGWAFLAEVRGGLELYGQRDSRPFTPPYWRFGVRQLRDFEDCVAAARPAIPAGSRVAFTSRPGPEADADFFRRLWAAYLLPEMEVLPYSSFEGGEPAAYVLAFRREVADPRLEEIQRLPGGRLYRVRTP